LLHPPLSQKTQVSADFEMIRAPFSGKSVSPESRTGAPAIASLYKNDI
jgi:hypothetical protein